MKILKYTKRVLSIIAFIVFFSSANLALSFVNNESHEMFAGCPYMDSDSSMCPMNLLDHFNAWKQVFTANSTLNVKIITVLLFILILPFILFEIFIRSFPSIRNQGILKNKNLHFKLFDWILLSLRKGILEPKIYAHARILA